jgi:hypothetical protein
MKNKGAVPTEASSLFPSDRHHFSIEIMNRLAGNMWTSAQSPKNHQITRQLLQKMETTRKLLKVNRQPRLSTHIERLSK